MFNQYPYLNLNDFNLDYILKAIKEMRYEVTNFVSINAIKYADPIQWNITSQYEKNTIVIDPVTGTAYISVAPVPAGVALTRPEYWTVVFDLGSFVTRAAQNFTSRWESDTTTTATFSTPAGAWLVWGDVLYKALVNITAGDTYVVGSNIEHFTIEDLYNAYLNTIANILAIVGDLVDLNTTDKTSIVNAINSVLDVIGDLDDLTTIDKTSIVNAINSALSESKDYTDAHAPINVLDFGVVGDGVTDDTTAFQNIVDTYDYIYIPMGVIVRITSTINITRSIAIRGAGGQQSKLYFNMSNDIGLYITGRGVELDSLIFSSDDNDVTIISEENNQSLITNCMFYEYNIGVEYNNCVNGTISNCLFSHGFSTGEAIAVGNKMYCSGINIQGCNIFGDGVTYPALGVLIDNVDGVNIDNCIINRTYNCLLVQPTVGFAHSVRVSNTLLDGGVQFGARLLSTDNEIFCVSFVGCWFMADASDIGLQIAGSNPIQNVSISDCEFIVGAFGVSINTASAYDISVIGCKFTNISNTAINVGNGNNITIVGNIINELQYQASVTTAFGIQIGGVVNAMIADNISLHATTNDLFVLDAYMNTTYVSNNHFNKTNFKTIGATNERPVQAPIGTRYYDTTLQKNVYWDGSSWSNNDSINWIYQATPPTPENGKMYFNSQTNRPLWYNGTGWQINHPVGYSADRPTTGTNYGDDFFDRDLDTMIVFGRQGWETSTPWGTTADRPTTGLIYGMSYFDTTLNKPIWYGANGWVDATGATV